MRKMLNHFLKMPDRTRAKRQAGGVVFTLFASVALIGVLGAGAMTVLKGPATSMSKVTKRAIAENALMVSAKLSVAGAMAEADGGDCDVDGMVEPLIGTTTGVGAMPTGGRFIPASINITREDPWGTTYGYCVWDHGSARLAGTCPADNRLAGQADGNGPLIVVISAGPDKIFQTTCAAAPTYVTRPAGSDDSVMPYTFSEVQSQMGGIWNLKAGDATTAQITKNLEVKDSGGTVNFSVDNTTGIGDFIGLIVGKIKAKLTAPVTMLSGLKIDNNTNVTSCEAGEEGTLRNHATNGVEVCDGTAYVAAGSGGSGSGTGSGTGGGDSKSFFGKITAGRYSTCGVRLDGTAYCWGRNTNGQLGDGTTTSSSTPVPVRGNHKFLHVGIGENYACGLRTDGTVYCWGANGSGQLGNGTTNNNLTPAPISGGHKFVQLDVGLNHLCGIRTDGAAYCWGANDQGQVGNGATGDRPLPTAVSGGHKFVQISAGNGHTCGLRTDGTGYCWGRNTTGQVGDGTTVNRTSPRAVTGGHTFTHLMASSWYSCGLKADGAVYCWGINDNGQIGDGTMTDRHTPTLVGGNHVFTSIQAGLEHSCGLRVDGVILCWGRNTEGQIGDSTITQRSNPTPALAGAGWAYLSAKIGNQTCAIHNSGAALCWGWNGYGQVGDGTTTDRSIPTSVSGFSMIDYDKVPYQFGDDGVACSAGLTGTMRYHATNGLEVCNGTSYTAISVGGGGGTQYNYNGLYDGKLAVLHDHTCIIRIDGAAYCAGENWAGVIGDGTTTLRSQPTRTSGNHTFVQISGEIADYVCALRADGAAYCWGQNGYGQIGDGTTVAKIIPTAVSGGHKFVQISAGQNYACGLRTDGAAYCWGDGANGKLGRGSTTASTTPVLVTGGHKFVRIDAGHEHTCGLRADGAAYCWGANWFGQVGDGTTTQRNSPTAVTGGRVFAHMSVGAHQVCGIIKDGTPFCWGSNDYGQLGDGTTTNRSSPTVITGGLKFMRLATSFEKTCALTAAGTAYCWGRNNYGQLGDGTTTDRYIPGPVVNGGNFVQLEAGHTHVCGIRGSGLINCWGNKSVGSFGDGDGTFGDSPQTTPMPTNFSITDRENSSFQFSNDAIACSAAKTGTIRYIGGATPWEYCNGTAWVGL